MRHFIFAVILVAILTVLVIFGLDQIQILPEQASLQAESIDWLFDIHFIAIAFLFSLIVGFMLYSIIFFRRKKGDYSDAEHVEGNMALETTWTVIPLIVVIGISFIGAQVLDDVQRVDPQALEVTVVGSQWNWRFEYPDHGISSTTLGLPVDQQTLLTLTSIDVIHSFWIPEFRVKQDALPGGEEYYRELRITPTKTGEYTLRCAELCGTQHAYMLADVLIMEPDEFDNWVEGLVSSVPEFPEERGRLWAEQYGCLACHSTDGSQLVGPTWLNVYGSVEELQGGTEVLVDDDYIRESIRNPGAQLVTGYDNLMPADIGADLTDEQVDDIIAFMQSLSE